MGEFTLNLLAARARMEDARLERERTLQLARLALLGKLTDLTGLLWYVDIQTRVIPSDGPVEYVYLCSPVLPALGVAFFTFGIADLSHDHVDCRLIELRAEMVLDMWRHDLLRSGLTDEAARAIMYGEGDNVQ